MPVCDDRSILVAIRVDTVRPHVCLTTHGATLSNFSLRLSGRQAAQSRAVPLVPCTRLRRLAWEGTYERTVRQGAISIHHSHRVVSQFLYTTGKSEQKSVSRFLFLDF